MKRSGLKSRALTLIELVMGLSIMAIILAALGTFTTAASQGWQNSEQSHGENAIIQRTSKQFERVAGEALYVVQTANVAKTNRTGYLFFWAQDGITGSANNVAEIGEMVLLEYVPLENTIWMYRKKSTLSATELAAAQSVLWDPASTSITTDFKKLSFLDKRVALIGSGGRSGSGVKVTSAEFKFIAPSGALPTISFSAQLSNAGSTFSTGSSLTLRTSKKPTNMK